MSGRGDRHETEASGPEFFGIGLSEVALALSLLVAIPLVLEKSGLRWTWALGGAPVAAAALALEPTIGRASLVGFAGGGLIALAWERDQLREGGHRRQEIRERLGFFHALWSVWRRRVVRSRRVRGGRFVLGDTHSRQLVSIPLGIGEGKRGASGRGPGDRQDRRSRGARRRARRRRLLGHLCGSEG